MSSPVFGDRWDGVLMPNPSVVHSDIALWSLVIHGPERT